jgi:hypothetical protein
MSITHSSRQRVSASLRVSPRLSASFCIPYKHVAPMERGFLIREQSWGRFVLAHRSPL